MTDPLTTLLNRLNAHRGTLIHARAEHGRFMADSTLRQVVELPSRENVIAVVEAVACEEAEQLRKAPSKS
jgi:hypothetical protein